MNHVALPHFNAYVRSYGRQRFGLFLRQMWWNPVLVNLIGALMVSSFLSNAEWSDKFTDPQSSMRFGWGIFWVILCVGCLALKLHRPPVLPSPANSDFITPLPLDERSTLYCALIDGMTEMRSFVVFPLWFVAPYFYQYGTMAGFVLFLIPFAISIDLSCTALSTFLIKNHPNIRWLLLRICLIILALIFACYAWEIRFIEWHLINTAMGPIGMWLAPILAGQRADLWLSWNLAMHNLSALSLYYLFKIPNPSLGWSTLPEAKMPTWLAWPVRMIKAAVRTFCMVAIFLTGVLFVALFMISFEVQSLALHHWISPAFFAATFGFVASVQVLGLAYKKTFALKRTLPLSPENVLIAAMKIPFMVIFSLLTFRVFLYFGLVVLNGHQLLSTTATALLLIMTNFIIASYCSSFSLAAGFCYLWMQQNRYFQWHFGRMFAFALLQLPFWYVHVLALWQLESRPLLIISLASAATVLCFLLARHLYLMVDLR